MKIQTSLFCFLSSFILLPSAFPQGSLTPPGAPAPTMKTLAQLDAQISRNGEKRIDVATLPPDGSSQYVISTPGSYYLSGNLTGENGKNCISIEADDVTLDLNGFALIGVNGSLTAIDMELPLRNVRISNGSIQLWNIAGIHCASASNSQFDHLRIWQSVSGLICGSDNIISEVIAEENDGGGGIIVGDRCTVRTCNVSDSDPEVGIRTGSGCTVTASTSAGNGIGFYLGTNSTIIGCTASSNAGLGISASDNCTLKECNASKNGSNGILVTRNCQVVSNTAVGNAASGIGTLMNNNRIDSNHCIGNTDYGIKSSSATADFIMRNSCFGNGGPVSGTSTVNYSPKSGQFFGALSNLNDANVSPWANF